MADILTTPIVDENNFEEWKDKFNQLLNEMFGVNSEVLIASPVMLQFSHDVDSTSGLDFHYRTGLLRNETQIISLPAGFVTLADNATNIVYLSNVPGSEEVTSDILGSEPTEEFIPLYEVVTSGGVITGVTDYRTYFIKARGSAAGLPVEEYFPSLVAPQTVFTLTVTNTTYGVGVYLNGSRLAKDIDYSITGDQEITLTNPAQIGDDVLVVMRDLEGDFNFDPIEEIQTAGVGGQDVFTLATVPVSNKVAVYVQGVRQHSYTPDSVAGTITLGASVPEGTEVLFVVNDSAGGRAGVPTDVTEGKLLTGRPGGVGYGWEVPPPRNLIINGSCQVAMGPEAVLTDEPTIGEVDNIYADCDDAAPGNDSVVGSDSNDFNTGTYNDLFYNGDAAQNRQTFFDSVTNLRLNNFPLKAAIGSEGGIFNNETSTFDLYGGLPNLFKKVTSFWWTQGSNSSDSNQTIDVYVRKRKIEDTVDVLLGDDQATFYKETFNNAVGVLELLEYDDGINPIVTLVEGVDYEIDGRDDIVLLPAAFGATGQFPANGTLRAVRAVRANDPIGAGLVARLSGTGSGSERPTNGYMAYVRGETGTNQIILEVIRYSGGNGTLIGQQIINHTYGIDEESVFRLEFDLSGTTLTANLYEVTDIALDSTSIIGTVNVVDATYGFGLLGVTYSNFDDTYGKLIKQDGTWEFEKNSVQPPILDNYSYQLISRVPTVINQAINGNFRRSCRIEDFTSTGSGNVRFMARVFNEDTIDRINREYFASVNLWHDLGATESITLSVRTLDNFEDITDYMVNSTVVDSVVIDVDDQTDTLLSIKGTLPANAENGIIVVVEIPYNNIANKNFEVSSFQFGDGNVVYVLPELPYSEEKSRLLNIYDVGKIEMFPYVAEERGYVLADGRAISRTKYARLFRKIGTDYGAGDGSTTFNVPDLRGEFIRAWDAGRGVDIGRNLGSFQNHQFQDHSHSIINNWTGSSASGTFAGILDANNDAFLYVGQGTGFANSGNRGSETRPRNIALAFYIKAE